VTEAEYYAELGALGFKPTGNSTNLVEEWQDGGGVRIYVTKPQELSAEDRAQSIDRLKRTLGIGYPEYPSVH
jgi:hypothetical protein